MIQVVTTVVTTVLHNLFSAEQHSKVIFQSLIVAYIYSLSTVNLTILFKLCTTAFSVCVSSL